MKDFSFTEAYKAGLRDGYQQALDDVTRLLTRSVRILSKEPRSGSNKSPENREKEGNK